MAGVALTTQSAKADLWAAGDVIMGFQKTGTDAAIVVNIGNFQLYRDATSSFTINAGGLGLDSLLSTTLGSGWKNDASVYWGVAAAWTNKPFTGLGSVSPLNGDPARTFYVTRPESTIGTQGSPYTIVSSTSQANIAANIFGVEGSFKTLTADGTLTGALAGKGAVETPSTLIGDWTEYNSPTVPVNSWQDLPFTMGNFGNGTSGVQLDFFRQLSTNTGASPSGTALQGSYEGSFTINDSAAVTFNIAPVPVPEPATYGALAGLGLSGLAFGNALRRRKKIAA